MDEARYRHAFDAAGIGFALVDAAGRCVDANAALLRILESPASYVLGVPVDEWSTELAALVAAVEATDDEPQTLELVVARAGAGSAWVRATASPVRAVAPDDPVVALLVEDVSGRRAVEDELARTRAELEERAAELERSNEDLARFASVASHDLSEPLRMVSAYVQLLARRYQGQLDADADEFIGFAVDGVVRMRQLIDDLLHYASISGGQDALTAVDLDEVVDAVLKEHPGLDLARTGLRPVQGRPTELRQLFANLVANAVKFQPAGATPVVSIAGTVQGEQLLVTVSDNGIGIPPEQRERVFTIFQRLHARHEYGGTGIGLALCRRIVEGHGGQIWIDERDGGGTAVHLTLRLRERT